MDDTEIERLRRINAALQVEVDKLRDQQEKYFKTTTIQNSFLAEANEEVKYLREKLRNSPGGDLTSAINKAQEAYIRELRRKISELTSRLGAACYVREGDKVSFDWAVLDLVAQVNEAREYYLAAGFSGTLLEMSQQYTSYYEDLLDNQKESNMDGLIEGRIVHFVMPSGEHRPAMVVRVFRDQDGKPPANGCSNLMVTVDGTNDVKREASDPNKDVVTHIWQTSIFYSDKNEVGTWHWIERA